MPAKGKIKILVGEGSDVMMSKPICRKSRGSAVGSALILAIYCSSAAAQVNLGRTTSTQDGNTSDSAATGDIIVTAQRRQERLQDVPITVTNISSEALGRGDVQQLGDIAKLTPGLSFDRTGGNDQPTIRGVGTSVNASGSGSNVGIYIDGFYSPNPVTADFQLLSVKSVDVLKGPQGTLFGRNSTGGAILVTTTEPSSTPGLTAEASYGSYNSQRYQAYATGPVASNVDIDVAALYRKGNGFLRNIATGSHRDGAYDAWSIRAGVKVAVSDRSSVLFRYTQAYVNDPQVETYNTYVDNGRALSLGVFIPGALVATKPDEVSVVDKASFESRASSYQMTGKTDFDFFTLTSYTQYRDERSRQGLSFGNASVPLFGLTFPVNDKVFTQELLLASEGESRLKWTLGAFYFFDKNRWPDVEAYVGGALAGLLTKRQTNTASVAAYADVTYEPVSDLFITGGLRYSHDQVTKGGFYLGPVAGGGGFVPIPSIKNDRLDPRVVIRYKPSRASSIYASFSGGHKAGILNPDGYSTIPVKPEKIQAFEAGYKYSRRGVTFDVSAFHYNYSNLQVASYAGTETIINNAAKARINGIESSAGYKISNAFDFSLAAAYIDAKYGKFPGSPFYVQCLEANCGANFGTFEVSSVDASGFHMAHAPKFTGSAAARYSHDIFDGKLTLSTNLSYRSISYFDGSNQFSQKGYELLSLRGEWTDPSGRFSFAIYGDNVTGSKYRNQVLPTQFGVGSVWGYPATIGASVRIKI